jgi:hypothetical protein
MYNWHLYSSSIEWVKESCHRKTWREAGKVDDKKVRWTSFSISSRHSLIHFIVIRPGLFIFRIVIDFCCNSILSGNFFFLFSYGHVAYPCLCVIGGVSCLPYVPARNAQVNFLLLGSFLKKNSRDNFLFQTWLTCLISPWRIGVEYLSIILLDFWIQLSHQAHSGTHAE